MAEASTLQLLPRAGKRARGFTYLSLIILVAIIGLVAASAIKLGAVLQRSRAEHELLDIGTAFSDALKSYADATPPGQPPQPPTLKELLKDPRFPGTRRHLRKIFVDPMSGKAEWGIVYLGDKIGVLAVYSLSDAKPVKIGNFPARYSGFEGKNQISEWKFAMKTIDLAGESSGVGRGQNMQDVSTVQQSIASAPKNSVAPNSTSQTTIESHGKSPSAPLDESVSHSEHTHGTESKKPPAEPFFD